MSFVCVHDTTFRFNTDGTWSWSVNPTHVFIMNDIGAGDTILKIDNKSCLLPQDITTVMSRFISAYATPTFPIPGQITGITVNGITPSNILFTDGQGVLLQNIRGSFTASVSAPASQTGPTYDPITIKNGTWEVVLPRQHKLSVG